MTSVSSWRFFFSLSISSSSICLALVLLDTPAGKDLDVHDPSLFSGGAAEGGVLDLHGLVAEDRLQEFLFRSQLGRRLGRDLPDQDVAGFHLGSDTDHA